MTTRVVHPVWLSFAETVGARIAMEYIFRGDYFPSEPRGCEGQYPLLAGIALLRLYQAPHSEFYVKGVHGIIESNSVWQMPSGGWSLSLCATANGIRFEASELILKIMAVEEDFPPTVTAVHPAMEYEKLTSISQFHSSHKKGFNCLKQYRNEEKRTFEKMLTSEALKIRVSSRDYHTFTFQSVDSLQHIFSETRKYAAQLCSYVKSYFAAMKSDNFLLLYGIHAALITKVEGTSDRILNKVQILIDGEITLQSRYLIPEEPGELGNRDGLRGLCLDESHLRNCVGASLAMSYYDTYTVLSKYMKNRVCCDYMNWIQSMIDGGKYYEYIDFSSGEKRGFGSSSQYLPIFWN